MKKNKILSLEELYNFYSSRKENIKFSSTESHNQIVVRVNERLVFSEEEYNPDEGKFPVTIKAAHIFENLNKTFISKEAMEKALPSFKGRPILGFIHEVDDGEYDFADHEYYIDDDGNEVYEEIPVGHTLDNSEVKLEEDGDNGKTYAWVDGVIYEEYTKAADILRKKGESDVSMEINITEMNYDAETENLNIEEFYVTGITILGVSRDRKEKIVPAMEGAEITFSKKSVTGQEPVIDKKKGGTLEMSKEKFSGVRELLNAAEIAVNEAYCEQDETWYAVNVYPEDGIVVMNGYNDKAYRQEYTYDDEVVTLVGEREEVIYKALTKEEFDEIDDLKKQNDALVVENEALQAEILELKDELEELKTEKADVDSQLSKYLEEPEKMAVLEDEDYSDIADSAEFKELSEFDAHCDYSVDELRSKCDELLLNYAKKNHSKFSSKDKKAHKDVAFAPSNGNISFLDKVLNE